MSKEPSEAAKAFADAVVSDADCVNSDHDQWCIDVERNIALLFDAHVAKWLGKLSSTLEDECATCGALMVCSCGCGGGASSLKLKHDRLLHELGIHDAGIEEASDRITELRAEARRSADMCKRADRAEVGCRALEVAEAEALAVVMSHEAAIERLEARLRKADELAAAVDVVRAAELYQPSLDELAAALAAYREAQR